MQRRWGSAGAGAVLTQAVLTQQRTGEEHRQALDCGREVAHVDCKGRRVSESSLLQNLHGQPQAPE
jgi:hypothetical protein